jgi:hypothetical protein
MQSFTIQKRELTVLDTEVQDLVKPLRRFTTIAKTAFGIVVAGGIVTVSYTAGVRQGEAKADARTYAYAPLEETRPFHPPPPTPTIAIQASIPGPIFHAPPQPAVYSAVMDALVAAKVDKDKVNALADKVATAVTSTVDEAVDELRRSGAIAVGSLVPLWIIALVALLRHPRRVDWRDVAEASRRAARDAVALIDERNRGMYPYDNIRTRPD